MSRIVKVALGLVVLLLLTGFAGRQGPSGAFEAVPTDARAPAQRIIVDTPARERSITVSGSAEIRVVPDEVILTLGVETSDEVLLTAKNENDRIVKLVLAEAKEYGVEPKHIQTDYLSIEPRYESNYEKRDFLGYFVRKNIQITLRDVTKFEGLLSSVLEAGVNYVHNIEFRTTELKKHREQARSMALKAAQEKALAMAKELGQQVGQPISIREEQWGQWVGYGSWWRGGAGSQNVVQNVSGGTPELEGPTPLGQISITAGVTVEFALE